MTPSCAAQAFEMFFCFGLGIKTAIISRSSQEHRFSQILSRNVNVLQPSQGVFVVVISIVFYSKYYFFSPIFALFTSVPFYSIVLWCHLFQPSSVSILHQPSSPLNSCGFFRASKILEKEKKLPNEALVRLTFSPAKTAERERERKRAKFRLGICANLPRSRHPIPITDTTAHKYTNG